MQFALAFLNGCFIAPYEKDLVMFVADKPCVFTDTLVEIITNHSDDFTALLNSLQDSLLLLLSR